MFETYNYTDYAHNWWETGQFNTTPTYSGHWTRTLPLHFYTLHLTNTSGFQSSTFHTCFLHNWISYEYRGKTTRNKNNFTILITNHRSLVYPLWIVFWVPCYRASWPWYLLLCVESITTDKDWLLPWDGTSTVSDRICTSAKVINRQPKPVAHRCSPPPI
jgi:hypothetical protein